MAKYKKRKDGRYSTNINVSRDEDGKPIRKTLYAKTIRELEEKISDMRKNIKVGRIVTDENITVEEWAEEWLLLYKVDVEYKTLANYRQIIKAYINKSIGHMKLKDVKFSHIQKIINDKYNAGKEKTAKEISITIKQIFKMAVEDNKLAINPAERVKSPKVTQNKKRALTDAEVKNIKKASLDIKSKAYLYTLLYTGLRKGEALALHWEDIDFKAQKLHVNKALFVRKNKGDIKIPKSDAGNRTLPMPSELCEVLTALRDNSENALLFPSAKGTLMSLTAFRRFWDKIELQMINSGTPFKDDVTSHIFRHTYGTMLYYADVDLKSAQYLMGHADIKTTLELYTHLDKQKTMDSVDKINNYIKSSH
jgi:integrase